ncbi:MAG: TIGR00725 family protein [Nitriliruptorales bacterium]|nr:TIGR00725 family protein [Nitriliruptorales bacterium]
MSQPVIAVIGAGRLPAGDDLLAAAQAVGAGLAAAGAVVVCGGLGGIMEAAARGAAAAGGVVVGILPGDDHSAGNRHLSVAVATGLGEARNTVVVRTADAVIAIGGEYGTLAEIGFALKIGRPVIGYRSWELAREGRPDDGITVVDSPQDAVARALAAAASA